MALKMCEEFLLVRQPRATVALIHVTGNTESHMWLSIVKGLKKKISFSY